MTTPTNWNVPLAYKGPITEIRGWHRWHLLSFVFGKPHPAKQLSGKGKCPHNLVSVPPTKGGVVRNPRWRKRMIVLGRQPIIITLWFISPCPFVLCEVYIRQTSNIIHPLITRKDIQIINNITVERANGRNVGVQVCPREARFMKWKCVEFIRIFRRFISDMPTFC